MARLDRATQYSLEVLVFTGSPGLACGSPEDDRQDPKARPRHLIDTIDRKGRLSMR
jgi:hypothetical protein